MTRDEIRTEILNVCKVNLVDGDFNATRFCSLCDKLIELGREDAATEIRKLQGQIENLSAFYEQACKQRDEVMDQQRAMIAAMRGRVQ